MKCQNSVNSEKNKYNQSMRKGGKTMNRFCMNRQKYRAYIVLLLLITIMQLVMCTVIYADSVDAVITVSTGSAEISSICTQSNAQTNGVTVLTYKSKDGTLSFSNSNYSELEIEEKQNFMKTALLATKESHLGTQVKSKVYNFITEQDSSVASAVKYLQTDTSADFAEAKAWFAPFSGPISTVLGLLCILIFVFMGASMIFDIAYLVLPGFQLILEHGEEHKRPFGVSNAAWKTNRQISDVNNNDNVMSVYLKKRIPEMLLISICLGYLVSGKIYSVMVYFIDAFS